MDNYGAVWDLNTNWNIEMHISVILYAKFRFHSFCEKFLFYIFGTTTNSSFVETELLCDMD